MKKHLLNNKEISNLFHDDPIVVLDGGARGELFKPFNELDASILKVLKFEPDPGAEIKQSGNEIIVPKALYDKKTKINLNVAVSPTTSSVFPFNKKLQQYIDPYKEYRKTKEVVPVECISLDEFCNENNIPNVDFIKLDIHGCECEVLEGAKKVLGGTVGLLVENWVLPIHKGQRTRAAVELFLYDRQFYVFEEYIQSAWGRLGKRFTKRQPVAIDTLYFKDPLLDENISSSSQAIKLIGLSELFEHYGFAWQLTEYYHQKGIITDALFAIIKKHFDNYNETSFIEGFKNRIFNYLAERSARSSFK